MMKFRTFSAALLLLFGAVALSANELELGFPENRASWRFASPGNSGTLAETEMLGKKCLLFETYLTGKDHYTEIYYAKPLSCSDFGELKVELYSETMRELIIRYIDATGQVFQYRYGLNPGEAWQTISCRFDNFNSPNNFGFSIWGGAKDRKFHFPIKGIRIGFDCAKANFFNGVTSDFVKVYVGKVTLLPPPKALELGFPGHFSEWRLASFGNKGSITQTELLGKKCLALETAFAGKNRLTEIVYAPALSAEAFKELQVELYSESMKELLVRYTDATNQIFQYRYALKPGKTWQVVSCRFDNHRYPNGKHLSIWGGAKDKKFHFPMKRIELGFDCNKWNVVPSANPDLLKVCFGSVTLVKKE